jgi:uncharacterized protein YcfL
MKTVLLLPALLGLLAASGCQTVNTTETAQPSYQRNMVSEKRVITDSSLARKVQILGANTTMTPGGFLKAQVELMNLTSSMKKFSYKWEWFDESGNLVDSPASAAISRQIEGKESIFVSAIAPKESARDFRLKLYENAP